MARPVTERMADALHRLAKHWSGKRRPKAFYLVGPDWDEFRAANPPTARFPFGNNPTIYRDEPVYEGVPVRPTGAKASRLYDHTTQGRDLPD